MFYALLHLIGNSYDKLGFIYGSIAHKVAP